MPAGRGEGWEDRQAVISGSEESGVQLLTRPMIEFLPDVSDRY